MNQHGRKMNPEVKKKWVEALRSGKYKQGKGRLKLGEQYCCLGVLCDLYIKREQSSETDVETVSEHMRTEEFLPHMVIEWAGLTDMNPAINASETLSRLNDTGMSFYGIATDIERCL